MADLLQCFDARQVTNVLSCEIRRPAKAGGSKEAALFEHPKGPGRPASVTYRVQLPPLETGGVLLLAFDLALADGIDLSRADGVGFAIEVEGRRVFSREWRQCAWQSFAVDLSAYANRRVRIDLITDSLANSNYDWALWGNPLVLHFLGDAPAGIPPSPDVAHIPINSGVVALKHPPDELQKLRIKPRNGAAPVEWSKPRSIAPTGADDWLVKEFSFGPGAGADLEWEPSGAITAKDILVAGYPPRLRVLHASAVRAAVLAGETVPLIVEIQNEGRGDLAQGTASVRLQFGAQVSPPLAIPALAAGESWRGEWRCAMPEKAGVYPLRFQIIGAPVQSPNPGPGIEVCSAKPTAVESIENRFLRLDFLREPDRFAFANVYARKSNGWQHAAVWRPLFETTTITKTGTNILRLRPETAKRTAASPRTIEFESTATDVAGVTWKARLSVAVDADRPVARIHYEWSPDRVAGSSLLLGPNIYIGDGSTGEAKSWGLFPGLEYLQGAERSSNPRDFAPPLDDRRQPPPEQITIPLMAVTVGAHSPSPPALADRFFTPDSLRDGPAAPASSAPAAGSGLDSEWTVGLFWDTNQHGGGEARLPLARFSSPNLDEGMLNHRLALSLPSAVGTTKLDSTLVVAPGPAMVAVAEWFHERGGLPKPGPWPRSFQEELDVCRAGYLKTLWNEPKQGWSHCLGWTPGPAPGFAALLWLDAHLAEKPEARAESRRRVELAARRMLADSGPGLFTSQANCHIMQWEFPFLYGCLPEALASLDPQIQGLIQSQASAGGWRYDPGSKEQADLGRPGDSVLGTCASKAALLLRYARITGDAAALAAGEKALQFMERFRVPRGGQTWECPMYEPDILAAAYAIRAYHDGYRATGNRRWLHDAVYWAESGVPFVYQWSLPDRPMMPGATIPVFGSTFYTHTWLGVPVQWCGLVYSYHVLHLARDLEQLASGRTDSPLPLALNFSAADWRQLVESITTSALHQQYASGERIGLYPDSISDFEKRNPAFINPEDILLNVLALRGHDPDVKTVRTGEGRGVVISSGANISAAGLAGGRLRFELRGFAGDPSHSLVSGIVPREILVDGRPLPRSAQPVRRDPSWWWDESHHRAYLTIGQHQEAESVEITY